MSGTVRAGLVFGLGAVLAFVASLFLPIPCVNIIIAFGSILALGWGAGYTAAKTTGAAPGQGVGRGATAGAIAGIIVLLGSVVALLVLSGVIMNLPGVREQIAEVLRQNPETGNINPDDLGGVLGIGFGFVGVCLGVINFVLMLVAGIIGGALWKGAPGGAQYVPAGGTSVPPQGGSYIPTQTPPQNYGEPPYRNPTEHGEGGARIYDPNDPNRPQ